MIEASPSSLNQSPRVAVVIPCLNEGLTIAKVVSDFKRELPFAEVYVFDNASEDDTAHKAKEAGARVVYVARRGKGYVIQAMFEQIEADVVVVVDGDDTYSAAAVHDLVRSIWVDHADMAVATRLHHYDKCKERGSFRPLHHLGNRFIVGLLNVLFGVQFSDILSGYRAFSRRFMVSMPVLSRGFEIETELTIYGITHDYHLTEFPVVYGVRPEGSFSKLNTWRDGMRIIRLIPILFKEAFPLRFFCGVGVILACLALLWGHWVIQEFELYHRVIGVARAVCVMGLVVLSGSSFGIGIVLDVMKRRAREAHRLSVQLALREWHRRERSSL